MYEALQRQAREQRKTLSLLVHGALCAMLPCAVALPPPQPKEELTLEDI